MNLQKFLFSTAKTKIGSFFVGNTFEKLSDILPVNRVYEDELVIAFWHPKPFWEKHILIVPKKNIKNIISIYDSNEKYYLAVFNAVKIIIEKLKWSEYTLLSNGGTRQEINQLHFHLCSGKEI